MSSLGWLAASAATVGLAMWLLLPRRSPNGRALGAVVGLIGLALLGTQVATFSLSVESVVFYFLATLTVSSAVGAVTFRSPVYCAIWFALMLTGTAALFLMLDAQFLGVATIVVYAGAILVTFLFVLMLAQPQGHEHYDRISWEAGFAAATGAGFVFLLGAVLGTAFGTATVTDEIAAAEASDSQPAPNAPKVAAIEDYFSHEEREANILSPEHVEQLGTQLVGRHLIAIEVAGVMLLVALVGAVAITAHERPLGETSGRTVG